MTARDLLPAQPRDLCDPEVWVRSRWRSRARRDAAAARNEMPMPSPRGLSLAALLAVTGVPALSAASSLVGGSGGAAAEAAARVASRGAGVSALQRALGVSADGVYGPQTQKAVRGYQRAHGMTVDGIAGPQTRSRLGLAAGPVLKRKAPAHGAARATRSVASRGGGVEGVQRVVGVGADGVFGPQTESAVKRWQGGHGLTADGVVGPMTRSKMGLGAGPVLKRKSAHGSAGGGGSSSVVARVVAAANRIATRPYVYGGGHGSFESAGYDCSGSVSYALHGGGLLNAPMDSSALEGYGAPGPGRHITVYANAGHTFMTIDGRRFDTSGRSQSGSRWGGGSRSTAGYVVRHPPGL